MYSLLNWSTAHAGAMTARFQIKGREVANGVRIRLAGDDVQVLVYGLHVATIYPNNHMRIHYEADRLGGYKRYNTLFFDVRERRGYRIARGWGQCSSHNAPMWTGEGLLVDLSTRTFIDPPHQPSRRRDTNGFKDWNRVQRAFTRLFIVHARIGALDRVSKVDIRVLGDIVKAKYPEASVSPRKDAAATLVKMIQANDVEYAYMFCRNYEYNFPGTSTWEEKLEVYRKSYAKLRDHIMQLVGAVVYD